MTKHKLFQSGVIMLDGGAIVALENLQGIVRFFPNFLFFQEVVTPRLVAEVKTNSKFIESQTRQFICQAPLAGLFIFSAIVANGTENCSPFHFEAYKDYT